MQFCLGLWCHNVLYCMLQRLKMNDDTICPRCRTTKYRNPNLKLLVNVCGHALCESCVELLFVRGSGLCPECNVSLRRANFRLQFFEDASIEKEIEIRKKILKDYNLKEDNFSTLREYNDYLEEVETIIFNLVNGVDVESTKKKVEAYKKENKELIAHNKFKKSADELHIENCIAVEAANKVNSSVSDVMKQLEREKLEKEKRQRLLIDNLMFTDAPAEEILESHHESQKLLEQEATEKANKKAAMAPARDMASQLGHQTTFMPIPKKVEVLYKYEESIHDSLGPATPSLDDIKHKGGGYISLTLVIQWWIYLSDSSNTVVDKYS
ncbi:hypothetical protein EB796_005728 [Bugula neritina]|uniref:CDK-activating kinase assembly factor MAT1 n=1 Tax=Bugula neritina TaxID=10212 RepID=A0A7J7KDM3_BUGNE|nr:hypothetical protein EB796_005728 [Bugula neritina]